MSITPELLKQLLRKQKEQTITAREMVLLQLYLSTPEAEEALATIDFADMPEANDQPAADQELRYQQLWQKIEQVPQQHRLPWRKWVAGVAAAIVVIIAGAGLLFRYTGNKSAQTTVAMLTKHTGNGELKEIILPDSSHVWLNARSVISYPAAFTGNERKVFLQQGEAFFQVTHNAQQPFIVQSSEGMQTTVLGTSFTVTTDSLARHVQVAVKTGKVRVGRQQTTIATLLPGDAVNYTISSNTTQLSKTPVDAIGLWTTGEIRLSQASFKEMASLMQQLYGIKVVAGNPAIGRNLYSLPIKYGTDPNNLIEVISAINGNRAKWQPGDSTRVTIH
jgi:ferric-dicitrate binding protein FerR (iron transport regulator)